MTLGQALVLEDPVAGLAQVDGLIGVDGAQGAAAVEKILQSGGPGEGEVVGL